MRDKLALLPALVAAGLVALACGGVTPSSPGDPVVTCYKHVQDGVETYAILDPDDEPMPSLKLREFRDGVELSEVGGWIGRIEGDTFILGNGTRIRFTEDALIFPPDFPADIREFDASDCPG